MSEGGVPAESEGDHVKVGNLPASRSVLLERDGRSLESSRGPGGPSLHPSAVTRKDEENLPERS